MQGRCRGGFGLQNGESSHPVRRRWCMKATSLQGRLFMAAASSSSLVRTDHTSSSYLHTSHLGCVQRLEYIPLHVCVRLSVGLNVVAVGRQHTPVVRRMVSWLFRPKNSSTLAQQGGYFRAKLIGRRTPVSSNEQIQFLLSVSNIG